MVEIMGVPYLFISPIYPGQSAFSAGSAQLVLKNKESFFKVTTLLITTLKGSVTHHCLIVGEHPVDARQDNRPQDGLLLIGYPPGFTRVGQFRV